MGLRHKAIHAMLANPRLAPFQLIGAPDSVEWILIDHLMVIHKIKESDYVEGDPEASVANMARTLSQLYARENETAGCLVLVKDGAKAPKPAVRAARENRAPLPHMDFCKRNLGAIEYSTMSLLAEAGMKDDVFLVTGLDDEPQGVSGADNLVSFHRDYLQRTRDRSPPVTDQEARLDADSSSSSSSTFPPRPSSVPGYAPGSIDRPAGFSGIVFVATFADPDNARVSALREACAKCNCTEADTLLVALANHLKGEVTVCTGDSDVLAVLTACGRRGLTLRMDNRTYCESRDMHFTPFAELLFAAKEERYPPVPSREEMASHEDRFRLLCDVRSEDEHLAPIARRQHLEFEVALEECEANNLTKNALRYLYLGGIRGPLYRTFLTRFCASADKARAAILDSFRLAVEEDRASAKTVAYVFETLCPDPDADACRPGSERAEVPEDELKRKNSVARSKDEATKVMSCLKRTSAAYMKGTVPKGSYGRFLRLNQTGDRFFLRLKESVLREETERSRHVFFMALCGTDYNFTPTGLGIKRLMTAALTKEKYFTLWCRDMQSLLWRMPSEQFRETDYFEMGSRLAALTAIPAKIKLKYWTAAHCVVMCKTMKYVCDMWNLKKPRPDAEYGFYVGKGDVRFDLRDYLQEDEEA